MPDVVGTEGKDEDEEGVERDHPEHVLEEHQRTIQTWRKWRVWFEMKAFQNLFTLRSYDFISYFTKIDDKDLTQVIFYPYFRFAINDANQYYFINISEAAIRILNFSI